MSTGLDMFYLPEKLAMFIPIFATLERNTWGSVDARKRNIEYYISDYVIPYFANDCKKLRCLFSDEDEVNAVKMLAYGALDLNYESGVLEIGPDVLEDIFILYDAGDCFSDWDFNNITKMPKRYLSKTERQAVEKFRKYLIDEIENMDSFILPPD